nr:hypothetical protein [Tanacetum cinerariifolium]
NIVVHENMKFVCLNVTACARYVTTESELEPNFLKNECYETLLQKYQTLEKHCITLEINNQLNIEIFQKDTLSSNESALTFAELFEINNLKAQAQEKDKVILKLKEKLNSLNGDVKDTNFKRDVQEIETLNIELDHKVVQIILWYLDFGCSKHMTGDRSQLVNFVQKFLGTVKFRNDHVAKIMGYEDYQIRNVTISQVYYMEGLGHNLFSVGQFCDSDLEVAFRQHTCFIRNLDGVDLLTGSQGNNLYTLSIQEMMAKGLVRGILKLKFEKDHLCSACAMGKSTRKTHKPKSEDTNQEKLYLLHMDLCGPMRVESVNGKKYILVIVDDYSRFTWVKFLRSKDETLDFIIKFLKMIQVRLKVLVCYIRTDNGTEFVNQTLREYYEEVGISHETSVARSPQQNKRLWQPPVLLKIIPLFIADMERLYMSFCTDLLFQPMFDELLNPPPSVVNQVPEAIAPIIEVIPPVNADSTGLPSSTMVEQDAPSTDFGDDNLDMEVAHMGSDSLFVIPILEVTSEQSTTPASPQAIVQTDHPLPHHNSKWTKDHPLNNIISQLSKPVSTRLQLHEQALFCYYDAFLTSVEPKTYKEALTQSCWIEAMQEALHEFEHLEV